MANESDYQSLIDRIAALREAVTDRFGGDLVSNPPLADALQKQVDDILAAVVKQDAGIQTATRQRLGRVSGRWARRRRQIRRHAHPPGVEPYDEPITSERIVAVGDLYYIFQHEKSACFE